MRTPELVKLLIRRLEHKNGKGRYYQVWATLGSHSKMECADDAVEAYRLGIVMARELTGSALRVVSTLSRHQPEENEIHVEVAL